MFIWAPSRPRYRGSGCLSSVPQTAEGRGREAGRIASKLSLVLTMHGLGGCRVQRRTRVGERGLAGQWHHSLDLILPPRGMGVMLWGLCLPSMLQP